MYDCMEQSCASATGSGMRDVDLLNAGTFFHFAADDDGENGGNVVTGASDNGDCGVSSDSGGNGSSGNSGDNDNGNVELTLDSTERCSCIGVCVCACGSNARAPSPRPYAAADADTVRLFAFTLGTQQPAIKALLGAAAMILQPLHKTLPATRVAVRHTDANWLHVTLAFTGTIEEGRMQPPLHHHDEWQAAIAVMRRFFPPPSPSSATSATAAPQLRFDRFVVSNTGVVMCVWQPIGFNLEALRAVSGATDE
jgi:hypothetical protein